MTTSSIYSFIIFLSSVFHFLTPLWWKKGTDCLSLAVCVGFFANCTKLRLCCNKTSVLTEFFSINTIASPSSCTMGNGVSPACPPCLLFSCCNDGVCFDAQRGQCTSLQLPLAPRTVLAVQSWCVFSDIYILLFIPGETSLSNESTLHRRLNPFYWGFNHCPTRLYKRSRN